MKKWNLKGTKEKGKENNKMKKKKNDEWKENKEKIEIKNYW